MTTSTGYITDLLVKWKAGDDEAFEKLYTALSPWLRSVAVRVARGTPERTTALVDTVFMRLMRYRGETDRLCNRQEFHWLAAKLLRNFVLSQARKRMAIRRDGILLNLEDVSPTSLGDRPRQEDLFALEEALDSLRSNDERLAQVVELRVFLGYTVKQVAEILGCSSSTVDSLWWKAKQMLCLLWLGKEVPE